MEVKSNVHWSGNGLYRKIDQRHTDPTKFARFRERCLGYTAQKDWVETEKSNPEYSGLFFIEHKDSPWQFDIGEFFINSKGKRFWMTSEPPKRWAPISFYQYKDEDGVPVNQNEFI